MRGLDIILRKKKVFTSLLEMDSSVLARKFPANSLIIKILGREGGTERGEGTECGRGTRQRLTCSDIKRGWKLEVCAAQIFPAHI